MRKIKRWELWNTSLNPSLNLSLRQLKNFVFLSLISLFKNLNKEIA